MAARDGHVHVLPLHVANKIAAGEVVERPASVVKELVENALDAGAKTIRIAVAQGGRKLVSVQDDGCGMTRDDALLSLERQATSKILDVHDIEGIDTLGFRGEAIPSIASVSRFALTTRRAEADEGTRVEVNAGTLADVRAAGCPPGTLVEVRDLFCNVPARRKFLRAYATEEGHVKGVFTVHALAHPGVAFSLALDGREVYRLAPAKSPLDRIRDLFGRAFAETLVPLAREEGRVSVTGYVERPNRAFPTRREQYVFVNGRPATAPAVQYALREAYPRRAGEARPAAILFISLPPQDVDVNVHPTKREIRFRDNAAVRTALMEALTAALRGEAGQVEGGREQVEGRREEAGGSSEKVEGQDGKESSPPPSKPLPSPSPLPPAPQAAAPLPVEQTLPLAAPTGRKAVPWVRVRHLGTTEVGYILLETDAGIVTLHPRAARERIAFERLVRRSGEAVPVQPLLLPETVHLPPADFHRLAAARDALHDMGFRLEPFGRDTFKVDAVPQIVSGVPCADILATLAADLASAAPAARSGAKWREDMIAKSVARAFAGRGDAPLDAAASLRLVEELTACRMPYVTPTGRSIMVFTSFRELDRKFDRD